MNQPRNLTCDQLGVCNHLACTHCAPVAGASAKALSWVSGILLTMGTNAPSKKITKAAP